MKKAAWFLPSLLEGSGGHRTILQNAEYLASKGEFTCDLYIEDDGSVVNEEELKKIATRYYGETKGCRFFLGYNPKNSYDLYFATIWYSAKVVRDIPVAAAKLYFIQDFEACFNPMGDGYLLACNSYCYGLKPITIGRWLTHKMKTEYAANSQYFDFCSDHSVYHPMKEINKEKAVCFIYQPNKPRRCSVIGIEALGIVKYMRPEVKIYLYGSKQKGNVWFEHTNYGIISIEKCNELYNQCSVGLCISSSNPSRIPFEMMSAGLPVVDIYMENNLYDMPDQAIRLAHDTPESIAEAIISILDDPEEQERMSKAGIEYMQDKSLKKGFEQFYNAVNNVLEDRIPDHVECGKIYHREPVVASVIKDTIRTSETSIPNLSTVPGVIGKLRRNPKLRKIRILRRLWKKFRQYFQTQFSN